MPSTRTLFLLSLAVLMSCATEKSATDKPPAVSPPVIKNFGLTTSDEVPVCPAAASGAQGTGNVTLSPDESSLTATVNYSGLSGPVTAAHIHSGAAGVAGPVVLPFTGELTSPFSKTFTEADYVVGSGAPPDFKSFMESMKAGGAYVNVHTAACKPGEIRGQIP